MVTLWNGRVHQCRMIKPTSLGSGRRDGMASSDERTREREREREREAGRKGRRIVYSNEGVNKWWAARRIDLGRARRSFDTALPPGGGHPPSNSAQMSTGLFSRLLHLSFSCLSPSLSLQPVSLSSLSISVSLPGWPLLGLITSFREGRERCSRRFSDHRKSNRDVVISDWTFF